MTPDVLQKRTKNFGWYFFGIVSMSYLMVYFHRVAPAVVSDLLMAEFNLSGAVLGNLAAIYFYVYTIDAIAGWGSGRWSRCQKNHFLGYDDFWYRIPYFCRFNYS